MEHCYLIDDELCVFYSFQSERMLVHAVKKEYVRGIIDKYDISPMSKEQLSKVMGLINAKMTPNIYIEVSGGCNLKCIHCYKSAERIPKYINFEQYESILKVFSDKYPQFSLKITGGEASMNPDILKICKRTMLIPCDKAHEIATNGTMHPQLFREIVSTGISLRISVYGWSYETFHRFTDGALSAYNNVITNIGTIPEEYKKISL